MDYEKFLFGLIEEAKIISVDHPSKDARYFAKSVLEYFEAIEKRDRRLAKKKALEEEDNGVQST